jgi:hypothetical protein
MSLTPAQQDAAARRELEAQGWEHWQIAELDAENEAWREDHADIETVTGALRS